MKPTQAERIREEIMQLFNCIISDTQPPTIRPSSPIPPPPPPSPDFTVIENIPISPRREELQNIEIEDPELAAVEELLSPKPLEAEEFFSDITEQDFRPPSSLNTPEPELIPLDVQRQQSAHSMPILCSDLQRPPLKKMRFSVITASTSRRATDQVK